MSAKDQLNDAHSGHHHKWKSRMKDWFLLPCSHVTKQPQGITPSELARHNGRTVPGSFWIAVHGQVYDVTQFMKYHPGGEMVFHDVVGKDCTWEFDHHHLSFKIEQATPELFVGPLLSQEDEDRIMREQEEYNNSQQQLQQQQHRNNTNDDNDDDENIVVEQEELGEEDRAALKDLFDSLLSEENSSETGNRFKNSSDVISEAQFMNFLASTGVTEEERDVTVKRLRELRPNSREEGVDLETFISLF